jgi:pyruvate,water dikinase
VTTDAYVRFLGESGLSATVQEALSTVAPDDISWARAASEHIQRVVTQATMPADVSSAIENAYDQLGSGLVAVRSSATAEDLADASFAGQQSTYLNIAGGDAVVKAVKECWASLFEERAIVYRQKNGFDEASVHIAVVVQSMIQSERSGIMFTVNPVTGETDGIVIEAIVGLGEAAVSGMVTPDMYILDKGSLDIQQREVSHQEQQLVIDEGSTSGEPNCWQPVPADLGRSQKLSDEQIRELASLGLKIEQHYGTPQDIEWALCEGEFFILQARPVTAAGL